MSQDPMTVDEPALCIRCGKPNPEVRDFCQHCRAPISTYSVMGPFESAVAEGWGLGEAATRKRPSGIMLIGLWLILGPTVLVWIYMAFFQGDGDVFGRVLAALMSVLFGALHYMVTRNYVRARPSDSEDLAGP